MGDLKIEVQGYCESGFEVVRDAFVRNFKENNEVGAATSVVIDGEMVVDIWAGHMDSKRSRDWQRDTIVQVMSSTKGIVSLIVHQLVERGQLDLDAPVAKYWPEFAQAGKEELPVRYLLTHQAGLPAPDQMMQPGATTDWDLMVKTLSAQAPIWKPGEKFGYHANTFGWLVGQVIRGATGKRVGELIQEQIVSPLGVDFLLGFGPEHDDRVAKVINPPPAPPGVMDLVAAFKEDPNSLLIRAFMPAMPTPEYSPNSRVTRAAEMPAANGHTNARALAKIYGVLACGGASGGVELISSETLARATKKQVGGIDEVVGAEMYFGLGFMLARPSTDNVVGQQTFGHFGYGGSVGCADPDVKLGFGYTMNQLGLGAVPMFLQITQEGAPEPDQRAANILQAVYASLKNK
ncbi:MAG: beta-lactamase family protein [Proteobacteria bacterium]|nr:beta-lactamase family protein [Pseudomonadota bacterium]